MTIPYQSLVREQAYACGLPPHGGLFRQHPEDFRVDEILGFEPEGAGDHVVLQVTKVGLNTQDVVQRLTQRLDVKQVDVGYCGLKDRHAITRQWFSVHVPGRADSVEHELSRSPQLGEGASVDTCARHRKKLRPGIHQGNRFTLVIGLAETAHEDVAGRLAHIRQQGFPNYFGEQRFGHGCRNLDRAQSMLAPARADDSSRKRGRRPSRSQRSLYLSAARGFIFNQIVSARIKSGSWLTALPGEPLMLAGTRSFFVPDALDDGAASAQNSSSVTQRLLNQDLHTTGILWGRSESARPLPGEVIVAERFSDLADGLEQVGLNSARRALRAVPSDLQMVVSDPAEIKLTFELEPGSYATALLRELFQSTSGTEGAAD